VVINAVELEGLEYKAVYNKLQDKTINFSHYEYTETQGYSEEYRTWDNKGKRTETEIKSVDQINFVTNPLKNQKKKESNLKYSYSGKQLIDDVYAGKTEISAGTSQSGGGGVNANSSMLQMKTAHAEISVMEISGYAQAGDPDVQKEEFYGESVGLSGEVSVLSYGIQSGKTELTQGTSLDLGISGCVFCVGLGAEIILGYSEKSKAFEIGGSVTLSFFAGWTVDLKLSIED
jgi:hypothetical protein